MWATSLTSCGKLSTKSPPNCAASTTLAIPLPIRNSTEATASWGSITSKAKRYRHEQGITQGGSKIRLSGVGASPAGVDALCVGQCRNPKVEVKSKTSKASQSQNQN